MLAGRSRSRAGFSLVEVIIVVGVVMILTGLALPALRGSRARAEQARGFALLRGHFAAISAYATESRDVYPIARGSHVLSTMLWYEPLVETGHLDRIEASDPAWFEKADGCRFALSGAMVHPPDKMQPGFTVPAPYAEASPIRQSDVVHPSEKGIMAQWLHVIGDSHVPWTYNVDTRPVSPIVRADGSAFAARAVDFVLEHDFFEDWVGHPVFGTWGGCRGRDRTK